MRLQQSQRSSLTMVEGAMILFRNRLEFAHAAHPLQFLLLEQHRGRNEKIEDEYHGPDEEDKKLHRDLGYRVEQQAEAALRDGFAGEVALHLRLVASEVGKEQERAADQAAPEIVAVVPI